MTEHVSQGRGKFNGKRSVTGIFILLFLSALLAVNSCSEAPTAAEKTYLDTLYYRIKGNEKALNIDEQELVRRKDIIRNHWMNRVADTAVDVRKRMEDDFRGMLTAYDFYLDRYLVLNTANRLAMEEYETFRSETDANAIDRKAFKEKYADLSERITANTRRIAIIAEPVYDLEPMWLRYKRMFGEE